MLNGRRPGWSVSSCWIDLQGFWRRQVKSLLTHCSEEEGADRRRRNRPRAYSESLRRGIGAPSSTLQRGTPGGSPSEQPRGLPRAGRWSLTPLHAGSSSSPARRHSPAVVRASSWPPWHQDRGGATRPPSRGPWRWRYSPAASAPPGRHRRGPRAPARPSRAVPDPAASDTSRESGG